MLQNLKRSIKHTSIYGTGSIASKLIGIILLPLYTKHISLHDFGVYGLFEIILQLLPIIALGLPSALQRWLGLKEYSKIRGGVLFTSFSFLAVYQIIVFLIIIPLGVQLSGFLFKTDITHIFYIICAIVYFQILSRVSLVLLRMDERSVYYAIANSLKIVVQLVTIVYLITVQKFGFISIFWGEFAGTLLLFLIVSPYLFKHFEIKFDLNELRSMIKFGAPTIFSNFSRQIFSFSDRIILSKVISEAAVGTYVLGFKISNILGTFLITSFNIAFPALAWQQVGTENQNRFFSKMLTYFTFVMIWAGLFLATFSKGIIHQFALDRSYWDATTVVPILVIGFIFNGLHVIINYGLLVSKKTQKIPIIIGLSLAIDIIINLILVSKFGYLGTAYAMMITAISRTTLTYLFSKKLFPVEWEFGKILLMFVVAISIFFITLIFNSYDLISRIIFKGLILLTFPFVLYFFNFYEQIELETIKRLFKKYLFFKKV